MPTRTLPPRPSLHQLKIQANELHRAHRDRDRSAAGRIAAHHPEMKGSAARRRCSTSRWPLRTRSSSSPGSTASGTGPSSRHRIEQARQIERIEPHPGFDAALAALDDGDVDRLRAPACGGSVARSRAHEPRSAVRLLQRRDAAASRRRQPVSRQTASAERRRPRPRAAGRRRRCASLERSGPTAATRWDCWSRASRPATWA